MTFLHKKEKIDIDMIGLSKYMLNLPWYWKLGQNDFSDCGKSFFETLVQIGVIHSLTTRNVSEQWQSNNADAFKALGHLCPDLVPLFTLLVVI